MINMNMVVLQGRLVRDPELRKTSNSRSYATVSLAVNDRIKEGNNWQDSVNYLPLKFFGNQAETLCRYCSKGNSILVEGHLKQAKYEKRDGTKVDETAIVVDKLFLLERNASSASSVDDSSGESQTRTAVASSDMTEDDLPF